jgi:hypothetical protein
MAPSCDQDFSAAVMLCHIDLLYGKKPSVQEIDLDIRKSALHAERPVRHPFESCFVDLGGHSAERALTALTAAVHAAQRDMNALLWITEALPGATLKPALAIGTVGELYRSYVRPAEFGRLKSVGRY